MKKHILIVALAAVALNAGQDVAFAQGRHGFDSGRSGMSHAFVPSIVADILLVPSLTKSQQTKIRTLYLAHRARSADRMQVMNKLRGSYSHRGGEQSFGEEGDSKRKSGDGKRRSRTEEVQEGMEASSANLRKTLFMSMMKEYEKFQADLLAVLNEKQKTELKEIALKAGSPDYFKKGHYDIMNVNRTQGAGGDRPD